MAEFILNAEVRSKTGKGESRRARSQGMLPSVIYGQGVEKPVHCVFKRRDVEIAFTKIPHRNSIMKIDFAGKANACEVIIRDYQKNPLNHQFEHIDFQAIDRKAPLKVEVDINLVGDPIGKKAGAILTTQLKTLRVECLPEKIPAKIDLDVSALDVGDSLHVSDIPKSEIKIISNPKLT
ncbi:MAG TPA: 50S ribosomal protein L25, partial [Candidatus Ozemobacteraceae bacterium]|nr:50S ribosomal protein L25 [Candidatus Ozemobacteraceae bacterium]